MIIRLYKKKGVRKIIFTLKREKHSFAERLSEKKLNVSRSSLKPPKFKLRNLYTLIISSAGVSAERNEVGSAR